MQITLTYPEYVRQFPDAEFQHFETPREHREEIVARVSQGEVAHVQFENYSNLALWVNDHHIVGEMIDTGQLYEYPLLQAMKQYCRQGIFLDVGACFGNHAYFMKRYCESTHVLAFEPNPKSFDLLTLNTRGKVFCYPYAASSEGGEIELTIPNTALHDLSVGGASLEHINEPYQGEKVTVKRMKVDDSLEPFFNAFHDDPVSCIKIDVEGHEMEVLKGAVTVIAFYRPELFIEIWGEENLNAIAAFLAPWGYTLRQRYGVAPVYHFSTREDIPTTYIRPDRIP